MKECVIIYNPHSGKHFKGQILPKFIEILKKYNYCSTIYITEYKNHAKEIVKNINCVDLVISIGGDGTFNEVMTGNFLRKDKLLLSHIPVGTTNDIGSMFGYGKNPIENLKLTLEGSVKKIDICTINNKPFIYVAAHGKFTNVPYETPRKLKEKIGYFAYIKEAIKSLKEKTNLYDITYEINGEKCRGLFSFIIVSSANRIAGINKFYKDVKLDDNKFEVLFCNLTTKKDIIKSLYFLTLYDVSKVPGLFFYKTDNLKIKYQTKPKKSWCIDGEELDNITKEYEFKNIQGIEILMPNKNIKDLFVKKQ